MSEDLTFSILAGILSGLVTSAILFAMAFVFRRHITPWFSDQIYRGIRVEGNWSLVDGDDDTESQYNQRETLELTQKASNLSGNLILVPKEGEGVPRTLTIEGVIRDRFLPLTCTPSTRKNLAYVSYLGEVQGDGTEIRGEAVFYDIRENQIDTVVANYKRQVSA